MSFSQNDSIKLVSKNKVEAKSFKADAFDANAPAKAAFFSAILPGLGQAYNGSYWKIPIVYGALGTSIFLYVDNTNKYNDYRDAYKRRLAGFEDDEFIGILTDDNLIDAQKLFRQNRDFSLMFTIGIYILNIIDANVEAHLNQFNISDDLSMRPSQFRNISTGQNAFGLSLQLKLD
jgi:hypothetical protein